MQQTADLGVPVPANTSQHHLCTEDLGVIAEEWKETSYGSEDQNTCRQIVPSVCAGKQHARNLFLIFYFLSYTFSCILMTTISFPSSPPSPFPTFLLPHIHSSSCPPSEKQEHASQGYPMNMA